MFLLPIKLDRVSFETKERQNLQKTADFLIESIVFCPLVPPSWISLVDPGPLPLCMRQQSMSQKSMVSFPLCQRSCLIWRTMANNDEYNDEYLCRDFFVGFNFWSRLCADQNDGVTSPPRAYTRAFDF